MTDSAFQIFRDLCGQHNSRYTRPVGPYEFEFLRDLKTKEVVGSMKISSDSGEIVLDLAVGGDSKTSRVPLHGVADVLIPFFAEIRNQ